MGQTDWGLHYLLQGSLPTDRVIMVYQALIKFWVVINPCPAE